MHKTGWLALRILAIKRVSTLSAFRLALPFHDSITLATRRALEALGELPVSRDIQTPLFAPAIHDGYLGEKPLKMQVGPGLFGIQGDGSRKTHHEIPPPVMRLEDLG